MLITRMQYKGHGIGKSRIRFSKIWLLNHLQEHQEDDDEEDEDDEEDDD